LAVDAEAESRLSGAAEESGRARQIREVAAAAWLAEAATIYPEGYATLDALRLLEADPAAAFRAMSRLISTVGGGIYPPRRVRLQRLFDHLANPRLRAFGRTLGGCRIGPWQGRTLVSREIHAVPDDVALTSPRTQWDRFAIRYDEGSMEARADLHVGALGVQGTAELRRFGWSLPPALPRAAVPPLPAVRDLDGVLAVPHLGWVRTAARHRDLALSAVFAPPEALTRAVFSVAKADRNGI
jgi:tRNA(Ile)-lysidine synthase